MASEILAIQIDSELRQAFLRAVRARGHTEAAVLEEFLRDYVQRARHEAEYDAYYRRKVEEGRAALAAGKVIPNDEVEARFSKLRAELIRRAEEADRRARRR